MPSSVCFVIPVLNEQAGIASQLQSLRGQFPDSQIVVVDGGSRDGTVAAAMPWCNQLLITGPGRASQMNLGAGVAAAEYVCFLHADTRPGLSQQQLQAYLAGGPRWGFCRVRLSGRARVFRVVEWFMNVRSALTRVATGDQMLFLQRQLFETSGGFDDIPLMEDVAYCKRLRREHRPLVIPEPVVTSTRRWEERGVVATVTTMWCLRLAYFLGVSPRRLWQYYYGR
jgi:rSAM/selenodomain-associated transferase 2